MSTLDTPPPLPADTTMWPRKEAILGDGTVITVVPIDVAARLAAVGVSTMKRWIANGQVKVVRDSVDHGRYVILQSLWSALPIEVREAF